MQSAPPLIPRESLLVNRNSLSGSSRPGPCSSSVAAPPPHGTPVTHNIERDRSAAHISCARAAGCTQYRRARRRLSCIGFRAGLSGEVRCAVARSQQARDPADIQSLPHGGHQQLGHAINRGTAHMCVPLTHAHAALPAETPRPDIYFREYSSTSFLGIRMTAASCSWRHIYLVCTYIPCEAVLDFLAES